MLITFFGDEQIKKLKSRTMMKKMAITLGIWVVLVTGCGHKQTLKEAVSSLSGDEKEVAKLTLKLLQPVADCDRRLDRMFTKIGDRDHMRDFFEDLGIESEEEAMEYLADVFAYIEHCDDKEIQKLVEGNNELYLKEISIEDDFAYITVILEGPDVEKFKEEVEQLKLEYLGEALTSIADLGNSFASALSGKNEDADLEGSYEWVKEFEEKKKELIEEYASTRVEYPIKLTFHKHDDDWYLAFWEKATDE